MNKPTKYIGSISIIAGLAYVILHINSTKSEVKEFKASLIKSRRLLNRLLEQLNDTKRDVTTLKSALQKMNLKPIKSHLDRFDQHLQPEIKRIQNIGKKMKK